MPQPSITGTLRSREANEGDHRVTTISTVPDCVGPKSAMLTANAVKRSSAGLVSPVVRITAATVKAAQAAMTTFDEVATPWKPPIVNSTQTGCHV